MPVTPRDIHASKEAGVRRHLVAQTQALVPRSEIVQSIYERFKNHRRVPILRDLLSYSDPSIYQQAATGAAT